MSGASGWRQDLWLAIGAALQAHVITLHDGGALESHCAASLLGAVEATSQGTPPPVESSHGLAVAFEQRVEAVAPAACAALSRQGRESSDLAATALHLLLRQHATQLLEAALLARLTLIELAGAHVFTLLPIYAGSSPLQPTNLAHALTASIAPLRRATARLQLALVDLDPVALGAGAMGGGRVVVDRDAVATLLGAEAPAESTIDAVSATDQFVAASQAAAAVVLPLERLLGEMLALRRQEPQSLHIDDALLSPAERALPHYRAPQVLERCLTDARAVAQQALLTERAAAAIPFGPRGDAGDAPALSAARALGDAARVCQTATMLLSGPVDFNRAWLARQAGRYLMTAGDLAALLIDEEGLPASAAQEIAALVAERAASEELEASGITPGLIDSAALLVIGQELGVEIERLGAFLAPRRFVEKRSAVGGPAPKAVRELLDIESQQVAQDQEWLEDRVRRTEAARATLGVRSHELQADAS
ncbi:MAG: lyase family protein [Thermomicrobiales bacterium]